jgi:hypothetical protein
MRPSLVVRLVASENGDDMAAILARSEEELARWLPDHVGLLTQRYLVREEAPDL